MLQMQENVAIENAEGRFIAFLDSDDVWLPEKISRQIRLLCWKTSMSLPLLATGLWMQIAS